MINTIAVCLLSSSLAYAQKAPPAKEAAPTKIFAGAKIFVEEGEFGMALGAAFIDKKVPVSIVAKADQADFTLKSTSDDRKASTAGKLFGVSRDRYHATVSVFNRDGILVFAYNVKKNTFQDAANSTANEIKKKQIEGR